MIFCGVYLATTIARATHQSIKWFSFEEMKKTLNRADFPETLGTFISCGLANDFHHLPLETICDGLFTEQPQETCKERLQFYQQHAKPLLLIPAESKAFPQNASNDTELAYVKAMRLAGFLAHHSLYMIKDNDKAENTSSLIPTLIQSHENEKLLVSLVGEDSSSRGRHLLETNPDQFSRQVFVEDIYANLPMERIDALSINIRSYAPHKAQWSIILPYQHRNGQEFEFYTPILSGSSTDAELNHLLFQAFWLGIDDFRSPTNNILEYYIDSKPLI